MTSSPMNFSTDPAHALDLLAKNGVVRVEQAADVLGVEPIGPARVADLVREEHRDRAALLGEGRLREGYAAGAAEAEADRIVLAAARADEHRVLSLACVYAAPLPYARAGERALLPLSLAARREPRGALAVLSRGDAERAPRLLRLHGQRRGPHRRALGGHDVIVSGTVRDDPEVAAKLADGDIETEPIEAVLKGFDDAPFELWRVRRAG